MRSDWRGTAAAMAPASRPLAWSTVIAIVCACRLIVTLQVTLPVTLYRTVLSCGSLVQCVRRCLAWTSRWRTRRANGTRRVLVCHLVRIEVLMFRSKARSPCPSLPSPLLPNTGSLTVLTCRSAPVLLHSRRAPRRGLHAHPRSPLLRPELPRDEEQAQLPGQPR